LLTFSEVTELEIVLINRKDETSVGAGESDTVTVAAIANTVYAVTRARLRQMLFIPDRMRAALAAR
jgi:CO/xanthine dehydrogenase Mo-binding subunit